MAKVGFWLQGARGKLAGSSLKGQPGGATVMAKINAAPANPNTTAQQGVRSSFKLISQLGTQFKRIIAIPREGASSSRNLFSKVNYPFINPGVSGSTVDLERLQLTKSNVSPGNFAASRDAANDFELEFVNSVNADSVVYVLAAIDGDFITPVSSIVQNTAGANHTFPATISEASVQRAVAGKRVLVYAYAIKNKTEAAATKYQSMNISTADEVAQVIINRTFSTAEQGITKTVGVYLEAGADSATSTNG